MTISSTTSRVTYTGNGAVSTYSYTFKIFAKEDLRVTVRNTSGVETRLAEGTDYTVTGVGETVGGTIVLVNASQAWLTAGKLTTGYILSIRRVRAITQGTDIRNQSAFFPETHEDVFDSLVMIDQGQQDELDRSVKLSETVPASDFDPTLPGDIGTADAVLAVNGTGDGFVVGPTTGAISGAAASATAAAASATAAASSASGASTSATAAASSATAASTAAASVIWNDVIFITSANSPYTIDATHRGKLIAVDTTSGAVTITLPAIAGLSLATPFVLAIKKTNAGTNAVTINRSSTDTIDGNTSKTISGDDVGSIFIPDTGPTPDEWTTADFGQVADNTITTAKLVDLSVTTAKHADLSVTTGKLAAAAVTVEKTDAQLFASAHEILNLEVNATVASNAITIAMKTGSNANASATDPVYIGFRDSNLALGTFNRRTVTGALSMAVSSGSTLGHTNGVATYFYVYAIDNAGTVELAVSSTLYDEGVLYSTTAEGGAGAADSATVIYSTTARTNVPIRLLARVKSNQATAGTWATGFSEISQRFTSAAAASATAPNSYTLAYTANGHGSTNTRIRRFTNSTSVGSDITYADSATLGGSFTINTAGVYGISYSDAINVNVFGISINSAELTTTVQSLTVPATLLAMCGTTNSGTWNNCAGFAYCQVGDVIRAHTDGTPNGTTSCFMRVTRLF